MPTPFPQKDEDSGEDLNMSPHEPGRRQLDSSTGKMVAYGVGGGSVIGVLTALFMFMNAAPWASKTEIASLAASVARTEASIEAHVSGPGHGNTNAEIASLKSDLRSIDSSLRDIKADLRDLKGPRR